MNKGLTKITAALLCVILAFGGVAGAVPAGDAATGLFKDETVYAFAGADGTVNKILVSDWIENAPGLESISDKTDMTDIEIVKGDATFTLDGGELTLRDAGGNDIYYRGSTEKELPLGLSVSYTLDGKSIPAGEIAGKSGKVTIRFDYENRLYETAEIDGEQKSLHVPFPVLTGMLLDNDIFRNVEVSGGTLINDGDRSAVIGFALPGLKENLGPAAEEVPIPEYVEITADVTDFAFGVTFTLATNAPFNAFDADSLDLTGMLFDLMGKLTGEASSPMAGLSALLGGTDNPLAGINMLTLSAKLFDNGKVSLGGGASLLSGGAAELSEGLNTLKGNNDTLNSGAKQVFETLLSAATAQVRAAGVDIPDLTVENYASVMDGLLGVSEGAAYDSLTALKTSLDDYNAFYLGLQSYTDGVTKAADGAASLASGTALLQKLADFADENLGGLVSRLKATVAVSKKYRNFSGIGENMDGRVKFIYRTEEIKADK